MNRLRQRGGLTVFHAAGSGQRVRAAALCLAGLVAGCSPESEVERRWTAPLASIPCAEEVRSTLVTWGAGSDMLPGPPAPGSRARYRFPTGTLGEWLLLEVGGSGAAVTLVTPERVMGRVFADNCIATTTQEPSALPDDGRDRFTDADLRRAVTDASAGGSRGVVIYLWSPHMPLSVDGYGEIETAAATHGLDLVPVLFPGSDPDFAAAEAARVGIGVEGLREAASVELTFRDAQVHSPSILVFGGDRVSAVLPGYRSAEGYREFLTGFIESS